MNVKVFVGILMLMMALAGCAHGPRATEVAVPALRPAVISHIVFIKLVDPSQADKAIADCDAQLASIPGVVFYACGKHFDTARDQQVNSDYDLAIYLGFDSREALDGYVAHPNHVATVSKWKDHIVWIRVQDVIDVTE